MNNHEIRSAALTASVRSFEPISTGAASPAIEARTQTIIQRATAFEIYLMGENE